MKYHIKIYLFKLYFLYIILIRYVIIYSEFGYNSYKGVDIMFSYLELENFKSFRKIFIDFRGKYKKPKNMVFLYGENGSGKSNIAYAFYFLKETMKTLSFQKFLTELDTNDGYTLKEVPNFNKWLKNMFKQLESLRKEAYMIGSTDDMVIKYGFNVGDCEGYYELVFDKTLKGEKLYYRLDKNRGFIFEIDNKNKKLKNKIFIEDEYRKSLEDLIEKYWGKHTLLSILFNEFEQKNKEYITARLNKNLLDVIDFLGYFSVRCKMSASIETGFMRNNYFASGELDSGIISVSEIGILEKQENALRELLTSLYSDIKDVYYKKDFNNKKDKIIYKLVLKKLIGGEVRDIDFSLESTGTQKIVGIFPELFGAVVGNVSIIDEADAGIHDLLFNKIIDDISDHVKGQLIITTHNTTLLESLKPENIYFILVDYMGNKSVVNITDYDKVRTQSTNNIRNLYLKGIYDGIPVPLTVDYENIIEIITK